MISRSVENTSVVTNGDALTKRVPIRTCVACRTSGGKRGLLRVVRLPEGAGVVVDATGKMSGRGAYVCETKACLLLALKKKQLDRSLKTSLPETLNADLRARAEMLPLSSETTPAAPTPNAPPGISNAPPG